MDVDLQDANGNTALMYATEYNGPVYDLLKAAADPNLTNALGQTALIKCFIGEEVYVENMCALIDAGADVNMVDNSGRNVLIWAASVKHRFDHIFEAVERILNVPGVNLDQADNEGYTAVGSSERVGNNQIAHLMRRWRQSLSISATATGRKRRRLTQ